jgi:hypothetical protein
LVESPLKGPATLRLEANITLEEKDLLEEVECINRVRISFGVGISSFSTSKLGTVTHFTSANTSTEKKKVKHLKT